MDAWVAGSLALLAVLLAVRGPARAALPGGGGSLLPAARWGPLGPVLGVGVLVALLDGRRLVLGIILAASGAAVLAGVRRAGAERRAERWRASVVELAEALAGELRAGRPAVLALGRCATLWAPFAPVAAAASLGADVPAAMRRLAATPGAEGLGRLASAWQVADRSGCSLAGVVDQVAASARSDLAVSQLVRSELSSAQATARLVAVLPVVTLSMAAGSGGEPWRFLLDTPAGLTCLAGGLALAAAGLHWVDRIAAAAARS